MRFLVAIPSRHRPDRLQHALRSWHNLASGRHEVIYSVAIDENDPERDRYVEVEDEFAGQLVLRVGAPAGKVAAFNRAAAEEYREWDVLVAASDDFRCQTHGWNDVIARAMEWHFPAVDGLLVFNDGYLAETRCPTLPIMGRWLWERLGRQVYEPQFKSFYCDNRLGELCTLWRKRAVIDFPLAVHEHGGNAGDEVYAANMRDWAADQATHRRGAVDGQPILSILIPTLRTRQAAAAGLFAELYRQIRDAKAFGQVEIQTLLDQKGKPVGVKRQLLLRSARGKYVCFVDDDDQVAPDYIESILSAVAQTPGADCVVFRGVYYIDGRREGEFDYDLKYAAYRNLPGFYERTPNHLCPVRRELALGAGFPALQRGEDTQYAVRLRPRLRTQAVCRDASGQKKILYHYRYSPTGTETQKAHAVAPAAQAAAQMQGSAA